MPRFGLLKLQSITTTFKPEFLNRIDEIITFRRLGKEQIAEIVEIQLEVLSQRLASRKIAVEVDDESKRLIADRGFDPAFGARPLRRTIQNLVQNPLAKKLLAGEINEGDTVKVSVSNDALVFNL